MKAAHSLVSAKTHPAEMGHVAVNYRYKLDGQDLADFISVSVYTGLRISDVCTFRIDRLQAHRECRIRTTKNGREGYTRGFPNGCSNGLFGPAAEEDLVP